MPSPALFNRAIRYLEHFETSPRPELPRNYRAQSLQENHSFIIQTGSVWHLVWDNGGEVGVEILNSSRVPRFAPMPENEGLSPTRAAATLAERIAAILRGEDMDFDRIWSEAEANVLEGAVS